MPKEDLVMRPRPEGFEINANGRSEVCVLADQAEQSLNHADLLVSIPASIRPLEILEFVHMEPWDAEVL